MKKYLFLSLIILLSACGKSSVMKPESEVPNINTTVIEESASDNEPLGSTDSEPKANTMFENIPAKDRSVQELQNSNYYNKDLLYQNGSYYRLCADGLYEKKEADTDWELLYETPVTLRKTICSFHNYLYFLIPAAGENGEEINIPKNLCRFNPDTLEAENIMELDKKVVDFTIYDGNIYFMVHGNLSTARYDAFQLNEKGEIGEQIPETSSDFICQYANEYHILAENNDPSIPKLKSEVLPPPDCAVMLNGCILLKEYKNEAESNFLLKNCDDNRETFLFSATDIFMVTFDGIYYWLDNGISMEYYSFRTGESTSFTSFDEYVMLQPLTFDENWLYAYNSFMPSILRISRDSGMVETLKTYEIEDFWNCFVCEGYLYVDGQIINAS